MYYLVDTNVFLHVINSDIYGVAKLCADNRHDITITQTILDELEPGYYRENKDQSSREVHTAVNNFATGNMGIPIIRLISLQDIPGAEREVKKIRKRFYSWMTDASYLQKMIADGKLTREDIKKPTFRTKDMGECELIAIAKTSDDEYLIVTNDKGRVYKHPEQNLFDIYAANSEIKYISGGKWINLIGYKFGYA